MKKFKKVFSLLLVMVMALSLAVPALAADKAGSITITNATVGKEYNAYKIFDATVGENGEVAYTISKNDAWYASVSSDTDTPFELTDIGNDTYSVAVKKDADALTWLKTKVAAGNVGTPTTTKAADSTTVTFTDVPYGYYYITSELGTVITVSTVDSNVSVIDKNQAPGWDPKDPENPDESGEQGKFVASAKDGTYGKENSATIDDTAYFKVNAFVPKYAGKDQVHTYTFVDTLADGFTYNSDMTLEIEGLTLTENQDYKITVNGQVITIELYASKIANYPTDAHLSIQYSAKVDKEAEITNLNTVSMDWTLYDENNPDTPVEPDPTDPETPQPPTDSTTTTYSYGFNVQKYKNAVGEDNKIDGAEFRLYDAATGGNEIKVVKVSDGVYRVAEANEDGVVIEAGRAQIFGLKEGTFYLEETKAPDGYNKLTARQAVTISKADSTDGYLINDVNVVNKTGAQLPETGGIGTTIFYVVGGVLMTGAVVLLITKKKMSVKKG